MTEAPEHRACRTHAPGERPRGRILDGPSTGRPTMSYAFDRWAPYVCHRRAGQVGFDHYVHEGGGAYRYAGDCTDHHEQGDGPDDWPTGCRAVDNPVGNERSTAGA